MTEVALGVLVIALAVVFLAWHGERRRHAEMRAVAMRATETASRAEGEALEARSESLVRGQILTAMQDAVILARDRRIIYANPAAVSFVGPAASELPPWIEDQTAGQPHRAQVTLHHPRRREVRIATAPMGDGALLAVMRDVTDEVRLTEVRRDFVANASHEMKTPVGAILATAETLLSALEDDPEGARRFADTLVREARSLRGLLQSLLDLARLDAPAPGTDRVSVSDVVAAEVERARPYATENDVMLGTDVAPSIVVLGNVDDVALLVRNLVSNAIRFAAGRTVRVTLTGSPTHAVLQVADTGIGIASADLPRIFERFYRADPARARATGGTGLGLALARGVAEAHGGSIEVVSELGVGTTFNVTLPVARTSED